MSYIETTEQVEHLIGEIIWSEQHPERATIGPHKKAEEIQTARRFVFRRREHLDYLLRELNKVA
jgi:hypothetical protein